IPDGEFIQIDANGDFEFPLGSVLVKQFRRDGWLLETRFYRRHDDGTWGASTYQWNEAQTDATLLPGASAMSPTLGRSWAIPSRGQCSQCHTQASGVSLGLEVAQLNADLAYSPTTTANQVVTLVALGLLAEEALMMTVALPGYEDVTEPIENRVRGYLHSNCSNCHRPGGPAQGTLDLRWWTSLADSDLCASPTLDGLGLTNPLIIAPGAPERSVLLERMQSTDSAVRMPRVGSVLVDPMGTMLIEQWMNEISTCP
ncbi:MAG: hypothetical protein AAF658_12360, partial [Myxococcota bacterium]